MMRLHVVDHMAMHHMAMHHMAMHHMTMHRSVVHHGLSRGSSDGSADQYDEYGGKCDDFHKFVLPSA